MTSSFLAAPAQHPWLQHNEQALPELQVIKEGMDKKFGFPWHVIVGKYFSYEVTSEVSSPSTAGSLPYLLGACHSHERWSCAV